MFKRTQSFLEAASGVLFEAVVLRQISPGGSVVLAVRTEDAVDRGCGLDNPLDIGCPLTSSRLVMDDDVLSAEFKGRVSWRSEGNSESNST